MTEHRWQVREVPPELVERYTRDGWWTDDTLGGCVTEWLSATPDTTVNVHSRTNEWHGTYADVDDEARRLISVLRDRGIEPGSVVAFQIPNWREAVVSFAALAMGGDSPGLNPGTKPMRRSRASTTGSTSLGVVREESAGPVGRAGPPACFHRGFTRLPGLRGPTGRSPPGLMDAGADSTGSHVDRCDSVVRRSSEERDGVRLAVVDFFPRLGRRGEGSRCRARSSRSGRGAMSQRASSSSSS